MSSTIVFKKVDEELDELEELCINHNKPSRSLESLRFELQQFYQTVSDREDTNTSSNHQRPFSCLHQSELVSSLGSNNLCSAVYQKQEKTHITLYEFIQNKCFLYEETAADYIFKKRTPLETRYVQMRATLINNSSKVIMFFNDITKIKELEKVSHKVRSMFLTSVAHELRTPLNSIIPMANLLRQTISSN